MFIYVFFNKVLLFISFFKRGYDLGSGRPYLHDVKFTFLVSCITA